MKRVCRISLPSSYRSALKTESKNKLINKHYTYFGCSYAALSVSFVMPKQSVMGLEEGKEGGERKFEGGGGEFS